MSAFFDSNVVVYLLSADAVKADRAETLLQTGGIVSVQVLNEVVAVCRRKLGMPWNEIDDLLLAVKTCCEVVPLTVESHARAVALAKRYFLAFYDAHICAAAEIAGAETLWSEDMQDGLVINGLAIRNPFRPG